MKKIAAVMLICAMILAATGCSSTPGKLKSIQDAGVIIVYTSPDFPPFEFPGQGTSIVGVDIEIAKAIAAELGVELKVEAAEFDSIIAALKGGKGDIAVSGFTITDERKESVDFSDPYIKSFQYLVLPETSDIATMEDLAGKTVGVAHGYTGNFVMDDEVNGAEDYVGVLEGKGTVVREYHNAMDATLDLINGRLDAVVIDEYVAKTIVANPANAGTKAIELKYESGDSVSEEYGVAVPKENTDLLEKINKVIAGLLAESKISEWVIHYSLLPAE